MGEVGVLRYYLQRFQNLNYKELESYPKELVQFLKNIEEEMQQWYDRSDKSGDKIGLEIATKHRGKPFKKEDAFSVVSAPHIGVVWVAAEYFKNTISYWQAGHIDGDKKRILSFPPMTKIGVYDLIDELEIKVRLRETSIDEWWGKIEKLGRAIGILQLQQVNGIWEFNWNVRKKSRQLFCQEDWLIEKLLKRVGLVARREIEAEEVWQWLDAEEKKCIVRERKINGRSISLIPQELKYGALNWKVSYKGKIYVPRYKVWEVKQIIDFGDLEKIEEMRRC